MDQLVAIGFSDIHVIVHPFGIFWWLTLIVLHYSFFDIQMVNLFLVVLIVYFRFDYPWTVLVTDECACRVFQASTIVMTAQPFATNNSYLFLSLNVVVMLTLDPFFSPFILHFQYGSPLM